MSFVNRNYTNYILKENQTSQLLAAGSSLNNSPNKAWSNFQLSLFKQYFTFGRWIVPWIIPASLSSLRCCERVLLATGITSDISPWKQHFWSSNISMIATRTGCPNAFANLASCLCLAVNSLLLSMISVIHKHCSQNYELFFFCKTISRIFGEPEYLNIKLQIHRQKTRFCRFFAIFEQFFVVSQSAPSYFCTIIF